MNSSLLYLSLPFLFPFLLSTALAQGDDFNDGNADGWTEVTPIGGFGIASAFSFPNGNSYRMESEPSTNEVAFGPARLGSIRDGATYSDFYQFVDVIDYDVSLDQNIGMLARVREPGLGELDGYGVTYNPTDQRLFFTVITDEAGDNLDDVEVPVSPGEPVRIVFQGAGSSFKVEVFALPDLGIPVATLEISDSTYASGESGLFVVSDVGDPALGVDCTFDNYFAAAEAPTRFEIIDMNIVANKLVFDFFSVPGETYSIWRSEDLINWEEDTDSIEAAVGDRTRAELPMPAVARRYYQIRLQ